MPQTGKEVGGREEGVNAITLEKGYKYQTGNVRRDMETLTKNQKEMLEVKNTVTAMENDFDELFTILNTAEIKKEKKIEEKRTEDLL